MKSIIIHFKKPIEWKAIGKELVSKGEYIAVLNKKNYTSIYKVIESYPNFSCVRVSQAGAKTINDRETTLKTNNDIYIIPYNELPDFLK